MEKGGVKKEEEQKMKDKEVTKKQKGDEKANVKRRAGVME